MSTFLGKSATHCSKQDKAAGPSAAQLAATVPSVSVSATGRPLDAETRRALEPRFGFDFSKIRTHTDGAARRSAAALQARAFTTGNDIVFAAAQPSPWLLAHELAHVSQQRGTLTRSVAGMAGDAHERHADAVADTIMRGGSATALLRQAPSSPPALQRAPEDEANSPTQLRLPPKGINPDVDLPRSPMEEAKLSAAVSRKVITFILGPDSDKFYKAAHEYWRQPGRTDVLVTNMRTLTDVLSYLQKNPPANRRSWGQVNLVTHANEEGGMGIKISAESQNNVSPDELEAKINAGAIPKVDGGVVDSHTDINVHGCAIGRSPKMLAELSQAFSGGKSDVYGPRDLQAYKFSGRGKSEKTDEFLIEYWSTGAPARQARSRAQLVQDLANTYGTAPGIDWRKAIAGATTKTLPYRYSFTANGFINVPGKTDRAGHARLLRHAAPESADWVKWSVKDESPAVVDNSGNETTTIEYDIKTKDDTGNLISGTYSLPIVNPVPATEHGRNDWLKKQIGADQVARFSWTFALHGKPRSGETGTVTLVCEGKRTVVRVERALKDPTGAYQHPSRSDTAHYGMYTAGQDGKP
jgi:hypothetical protein